MQVVERLRDHATASVVASIAGGVVYGIIMRSINVGGVFAAAGTSYSLVSILLRRPTPGSSVWPNVIMALVTGVVLSGFVVRSLHR
jgi:hypothetical protein